MPAQLGRQAFSVSVSLLELVSYLPGRAKNLAEVSELLRVSVFFFAK
jgi:hypothetical protein